MVFESTELGNQLQTFRSELQLQADLNAFEKGVLHGDPVKNGHEWHTLLLWP